MRTPKILVVDDEPDILESVRFGLEKEGYDVITATDGEAALRKAKEFMPDLIVLDVMMPKENGYRVARRVRERERKEGGTRRVPIILLTARNLQEDPEREKMFKSFAQADLVMYKPFDMDDLGSRIRGLLRGFTKWSESSVS